MKKKDIDKLIEIYKRNQKLEMERIVKEPNS